MSYVIAAPDLLANAASDLASIGSHITAANFAAALPTNAVAAAGADEVSAAIAALFGSHAQQYQALSAQVSAFHDQFVQTLTGGANAYAIAEAANASPIQTLLDAINAPSVALTGRALIGNGANATTPGGNGGAGGWLYGNGGAGAAGAPGQAGGN
ncbi:PE family protein, partial [Mycobacterium szulgai]